MNISHISAATQIATNAYNPFQDLVLTSDEVNEMKNSTFLIPDMIVQGHITVFAAPANGGKTTLFLYLCEQLAAQELRVVYINADSSPGDLKDHFEHANKHGYQIISPDTKAGKSVENVLDRLTLMNTSDARCDGFVLIFDTLKKFVDMLDKKQLKALLAVFRKITVKGATVCLLAHTNKYAGSDGKTIYEGMGDLRTDVDELIYLDGSKNPDTGHLEVTTRIDKLRAEFRPRSYIIELPNRTVKESASVITILSDQEVQLLQLVIQAINNGHDSQQEILSSVKVKAGMGQNAIRDAMNRFANVQDAKIKVSPRPGGKGYKYSVV